MFTKKCSQMSLSLNNMNMWLTAFLRNNHSAYQRVKVPNMCGPGLNNTVQVVSSRCSLSQYHSDSPSATGCYVECLVNQWLPNFITSRTPILTQIRPRTPHLIRRCSRVPRLKGFFAFTVDVTYGWN